MTSMRGRPSSGSGMMSKPVTRVEVVVPHRHHADQPQRHGEFLARGAHRRRAPEVEHHVARIVAMVLQMPRQQRLGEALALVGGVAARHRARIDGEQIAPGRQHVAPSAPRRSGRAGRHAAAVERGEQRRAFAGGAMRERHLGRLVDAMRRRLAEHVQAVGDQRGLDVADEGVEPHQRFARRHVVGEAAVAIEPGFARGDR